MPISSDSLPAGPIADCDSVVLVVILAGCVILKSSPWSNRNHNVGSETTVVPKCNDSLQAGLIADYDSVVLVIILTVLCDNEGLPMIKP